ncbi:MAG: substrate-binding domain-containing protein [Oscillospiraceae bacterium]|jgi:phosphate transport system substrate-binding protein|nr:substrate-binding domain-containing protein [Oscillospiraceae bacterium]
MKRLLPLLLVFVLLAGCAAQNLPGENLPGEASLAPTMAATAVASAPVRTTALPVPADAIGIPFVWDSEIVVVPSPAPGINVENELSSVFPDNNGENNFYYKGLTFDGGRTQTTRFFEVIDGSAWFLFSVYGVGEYRDFDQDGEVGEILAYTSYDDGHTLCVYQYKNGVLRQSDLINTLGGDAVSMEDDIYTSWQIDRVTANISIRKMYIFDGEFFYEIENGNPDKLGSWGSINVSSERGDDWRQIVNDSEFQLGEKFLAGHWGVEPDIQEYYYKRFGTYPRIDGSTVCVPLALEFARQHLDMTDAQAYNFVGFNTTPEAYRLLITKQHGSPSGRFAESEWDWYQMDSDNRPVDIILATYPSDEELEMAETFNEPLIIEPICSDSFVFITRTDNPVDNLTLEQVRKIYSGEITNWSELGGSDLPIKAYQREKNSGSQSGMEQLVMQNTPMAEPITAAIVETMEGLINTVAEYQNGLASIGYTYKYYVERLYQNDNIKILKIDGYEAGSENYPLNVNYYAAIRENDGEDSIGRKFLNWILSDEGQLCVKQAGY